MSPDAGPRGGIPRLRAQSIALLSYGFRPFFLGAALWACIAMVLWIGLLSGSWSFAIGYGVVAWHAHEFLFGYIAAVMTGFLLTAIPNWTGRLPLQGMPLLALFLLWLAGRAAMLQTDWIGTGTAASIDCVYLITVTAVISREIVAGSNWRNLRVVVLVALTAIANIAFQAEMLIFAVPNYGLRLGVAAIVALIMVVGGRVTPSFTSNWLTRQGNQTRPAPFSRFDIGSIALGAVALITWIAAPDHDARQSRTYRSRHVYDADNSRHLWRHAGGCIGAHGRAVTARVLLPDAVNRRRRLVLGVRSFCCCLRSAADACERDTVSLLVAARDATCRYADIVARLRSIRLT